jgi:hypothetical protein
MTGEKLLTDFTVVCCHTLPVINIIMMVDKILTGIEKQKAWCEELLKNIDSPIYTARNWRDNSGKFVPGKQNILGSQVPPIDHRSIGSNEVVIELDFSYPLNVKYTHDIKDYLSSQEIPHYCFWSGNKSIHIHVFLDIPLKDKNIIKTVKESINKGCNIYRAIRLKLAKEIIVQSGMSEDLIGHGSNKVDLAKLAWNDLENKTSLIRMCGGANKKVNNLGKIDVGFKTYLPTIPSKKPSKNSQDFDQDVAYPNKIKKYKLDEQFVYSCAKDYLNQLNNPRISKEIELIDYKGDFMSLPCIQTLLEGKGEGERSFGAQQVAIACRLDKLKETEAIEVIEKYCKNCTPFLDVEEGKKWVKWIYTQINPYFACGNCKKLKVCEPFGCNYHKEKYADESKVLATKPMEAIKNMLDKLVVGEDKLKMQLVLLYLTKDDDPEWCIMLDGPSSSGKTHVMKAVACLFGEEGEAYHVYSRVTGGALNRINPDKWMGAIIIFEELQGLKAAVEQLRVLISERQLTLVEPVEFKNPDGTKCFKNKETKIKLKNTLFVTCNAEKEDEGDQLRSRSWILNTDISPEQTKAIVDDELNKFSEMDLSEEIKEELYQYRTAFSLIRQPDKVVFPFSKELSEMNLICVDTVRGRRDVKKLKALIKASARLHGSDRVWIKHKGKDVLIADWRDVAVTMEWAGEALNASTQGVGNKDLEAYEVINLRFTQTQNEYFEIDDVVRWLKQGKSISYKIMANLINAGFFENISTYGMKAQYKKTAFTPHFYKDSMKEINEKIAEQDKKLQEFVKIHENDTK